MQGSLPVAERPRRPEWMKVRAPSAGSRYFDVRKLIRGASLHTIGEEARCPNIGECWGHGTATFQILGDTCTRACRYCYVHSGKPDGPPDPLQPLRLRRGGAEGGGGEDVAGLAGERRRRRHDRAVPAALGAARADRPLGTPRRVQLVPRAERGARLRLHLLRAARAFVLPRRRAT